MRSTLVDLIIIIKLNEEQENEEKKKITFGLEKSLILLRPQPMNPFLLINDQTHTRTRAHTIILYFILLAFFFHAYKMKSFCSTFSPPNIVIYVLAGWLA